MSSASNHQSKTAMDSSASASASSSSSSSSPTTTKTSFLSGSGCAETSTVVIALAILLVTLYVVWQFLTSRKYPPGPSGIPLLGYLDVLWSADRKKLLRELGAKYGDVYCFPLGCRLVVVVTGLDALKRVFGGGGGGGDHHHPHQQQQGSSSTSSTSSSSSSSFVGRSSVFAVTSRGKDPSAVPAEVWQELRRFSADALRPLAIGEHAFENTIKAELRAACSLLDTLALQGTATDADADADADVDVDVNPGPILHAAAANIILAIVFGKRFDYDDPTFSRFIAAFQENLNLSTGSILHYFFPFLHFLPLLGDAFQRNRRLRNGELVQGQIRQWVEAAKRRFNPQDVADLTDAYYHYDQEERKKGAGGGDRSGGGGFKKADEQLQLLVSELLVAGTEFTATTLHWLLVFLVRWPHVQRKLRQEIDGVYPAGKDTTPSVKDRARMPYVESTLLECQRYADVCPLSLARVATQTTSMSLAAEEEGSSSSSSSSSGGGGGGGGRPHREVPRGALVVPNLHSVHHDPSLWGDPENFRPERFLDEEGKVVRPEYLLSFSLGQRSCPAQDLGKMELFLFLTTLLQRYEIRPAGQGKLPSLDYGHMNGIAYVPYSYKLRFVRRD